LDKFENCCHLKDILKVERSLILKHVANHRWYNQFNNDQETIVDFIHKYAWLMREVFCTYMCKYRHTCSASDEFKKVSLPDISDGEIEKYIQNNYEDTNQDIIKMKLRILKHDITVHKWLNNIDNYPDGIKDFLNRFGWIIYEIYQLSQENQ